MNQRTLMIVLSIFIVAMILIGAVYIISPKNNFLGYNKGGQNIGLPPEKVKVIEEKLVIPETEIITGGEGRLADEGPVEVPLVPKTESEKVAVSKAALTVKGSYDLAINEAGKWADDFSLVFIKSMGALTLEGKSSQWQLVFSSEENLNKGYEIIIQGDRIVSKKEIESQALGAGLPKIWKDSGEIIILLQQMPQFSDATVSSINLYYNADGKIWRYVLSTSKGSTSVSAE